MKKWASFLLTGIFVFSGGIVSAGEGPGPTVSCASLSKAPTLDGKNSEWKKVPVTKVKVSPAQSGDKKNYTGEIEVEVRAATHGDSIYLLVEWPDTTQDASHKTLHWDAKEDGYVEGKDREDRLAMVFDMDGDFKSCMLTGAEYKVDVWHWKAYRSQSAGVAHDKMHIYSFAQLPKAKKHTARNGKEIWIARPGDKGDKLYKSQRPIDNIGATVPRYLPNKAAKGSVADVKSAAVWENNKWTLELSRRLNTGHDDDVVFKKGNSYKGGVAVFNHTGDDHHSTGPFVLEITAK